jgi:hypothetical protein
MSHDFYVTDMLMEKNVAQLAGGLAISQSPVLYQPNKVLKRLIIRENIGYYYFQLKVIVSR